MNFACVGDKLGDMLDNLGLMAEVTFKRIDETNSNPASSMYRERKEADKVYDTWILKAVVDERPSQNTYGRTGGEVTAEIVFLVYKLTAHGGTEINTVYVPQERDKVDYRGETYEVTAIDRVQPFNTNEQMAYLIDAKRFR